MPAPLYILIPTHRRASLLRKTLLSLAACRLPEEYREAIVVENGDRTSAEAVVASVSAAYPHLRLRYMYAERPNKSLALNAGLATIGDGLVVFYDDDVQVEPESLQAYAEASARHPARAFFGGPCDVDYEVQPEPWLLEHLPSSARGYEVPRRPPHTWYVGFNWAAFTSDLRAVGGFDRNFGPGSPMGNTGQETELQKRLKELGCKRIDVPAARVTHYVPRRRCNPEWLLRRKYADGFAKGLTGRDRDGRRRSLDPLRRVYKHGRCLVGGVASGLMAYVLGRESDVWKARYDVSHSYGFFRGYLVSPRGRDPRGDPGLVVPGRTPPPSVMPVQQDETTPSA